MGQTKSGGSRVQWIRRTVRVHCRRIDRMRELEEHLTCPYCRGRKAAVAHGEHSRFCDYDPEVDPISFGFPERGSRFWKG